MNYLPALIGPTPEWMNQALCAEIGPDMGDEWFPHAGNSATNARNVCSRCPVRLQCLTYAQENNIREGIWGGLGETDRAKLRRQTKRKGAAA